MLTFLMAAALVQAAGALAPVADVRQLTLSEPKVVAEIDTAKVQGAPIGLAWSKDGVIYLRVTQGKDKSRHYQIATAPSISVGQTDGAPEWAADYWNWKGAIVSPGDPGLKLDVEQRVDRTRSVNVSSGGADAGMAAGLPPVGEGQGVSQAVAASAANATIASNVVTLRFRGQVVGEWVNENPQPGMRIGWAPAPMGLLAYTDADGHLLIADREGRHVTIQGTKSVLLPAWSIDGKQIVFLQKKSDKVFSLMVATVR
jgi:hypothetical protein